MMKGNYDFVFNIWDLSKGIADNPFLLEDGAFVDCAWADIRNFLPESWKAKAMTEAFTTNWKEMYCWIESYFFWEDWHWYNTSWTRVLLTWQNDDILWCEKYNWRYLLFDDNGSSPRISKVDVTDATGSSDWTSELSWALERTPTDRTTYRKSQWSYWVSTLLYQGNLYFSNNDQVLILDENDTVFQWLKCPAEVVWVTVYWARIKVYCANWQILFRNWLDWNSWDESIDLWQPIFAVWWKAWKDYLFAWDDSWWLCYLYEMNWYSLTKITDWQKSYMSVRPWSNSTQHAVSLVNWILYFPWGLASDWIYTYWSAFPWIAPSLCYEFDVASTGNQISVVNMIREYGNVIYVSYEDTAWTIKMDKISSSSVWTSAYITSEALWDRITMHSVLWLELRASWRVVVEYRHNQPDPTEYNRRRSIIWWRTEWFDSDDYTYEDDILRIHWIEADLPDFRDIQFKITYYDTFWSLNIYGHHVWE